MNLPHLEILTPKPFRTSAPIPPLKGGGSKCGRNTGNPAPILRTFPHLSAPSTPQVRIGGNASFPESAKATLFSVMQERRARAKCIPDSVADGPAWHMLLELAAARMGEYPLSVTSLCYASFGPATTALRHIGVLAKLGMVEFCPHSTDGRVRLVSLSDRGVAVMGDYLTATA